MDSRSGSAGSTSSPESRCRSPTSCWPRPAAVCSSRPSPREAQVTVGGEYAGVSPIEVLTEPNRELLVQVARPGYEAAEGTVQLAPQESATISLRTDAAVRNGAAGDRPFGRHPDGRRHAVGAAPVRAHVARRGAPAEIREGWVRTAGAHDQAAARRAAADYRPAAAGQGRRSGEEAGEGDRGERVRARCSSSRAPTSWAHRGESRGGARTRRCARSRCGDRSTSACERSPMRSSASSNAITIRARRRSSR